MLKNEGDCGGCSIKYDWTDQHETTRVLGDKKRTIKGKMKKNVINLL